MKRLLALAITVIIIFTLFLSGCTNIETPVKVTETSIVETDTTNTIVSETKVTSETSQETSAATADKIIFSSLNNDQGTIYICNPDGSDLQKLIDQVNRCLNMLQRKDTH